MYLPKSKFTSKYAKPGEYSLNGKEYIGSFFTDFLGTNYAGTLGDIKGILSPMHSIEVSRNSTVPGRKPTQKEYQSGSMDRYFKQDKRNLKMSELSVEDWSGSLDMEKPRHLQYVTASWILTGSLDDTQFGKYSYRGVRSRNQETLDYLESKFEGITGSLELSAEDFVVEHWKPGISASKLKVQ